MAAPGAGFLSSHLACVGELECLLLGGGRVVMLNCVCSARLSLLWCAFLIACGQVGVRAQLFLSGQNPASTSADLMVTLAWDPCPCPDVNGYFLCWGLASGACTNFLDVGNVTNATIAGLVSNVDYYFTAVSYDVEGNQSLPSSEIRYSPSLANPTVTAWPVASTITYGQTLACSTLSGGSASSVGGFTFTEPSTIPDVGTALQSVTFTPTDTANYNTAYGSVSVTVVESLPPDAWFRVGDGPEWYTLPPCYSAREAAALLFGGTLSQYAVSTDPYNINHMAWVDGRGDTTYLNTPASEDFKGGVLYDDSGSYSAYVGDHLDLSLSKTNYVWFSVAPVIIGPPQSEVGQIGGSASLQVAAIGADELSFQWYLNETNLVADGTNSVLLLTDVNPDQLGSYVVVVSNAYGSVTSAPTSLAVVRTAAYLREQPYGGGRDGMGF